MQRNMESYPAKAIYRSWGIACSGTQVYSARHRAEWLEKIREPGVRRRAVHYLWLAKIVNLPSNQRDESAPTWLSAEWNRSHVVPTEGFVRSGHPILSLSPRPALGKIWLFVNNSPFGNGGVRSRSKRPAAYFKR